jgi:serine/threonine protein kinase
MNILVTEDYSCKLTDFGTAKLAAAQQVMMTVNAGTPLWMAPEVRIGQYSFPADIFR